LAELNKLQKTAKDPARASQLREGAELAVKLADLLRRMAADAARTRAPSGGTA
jgi:hypothetical protein